MKKKKVLHQLMIISFALLLCLGVQAQQRITGILHSSANQPVIGATVTVKGTNTSVTSDNNGRFSINAPLGSTLIISSVEFVTKEVTAASTPMNIELQVNDSTLNEVVVIGYQTVRKRDLTGATGVVDLTNSNKITSASIGESIHTLIPGVTVRNGGAPGQNSVIEIKEVLPVLPTATLYT